jgi:hypothetical protein
MAACAIGALALVFVTETVGCSLRGRHISSRAPLDAQGRLVTA